MKKTKSIPTQFRQGDVLLRRIASIPQSAKRQDINGSIILALGEVTGHAHAIHDLDSVDVLVGANGEMYLRVKEAAALTHEEHATITLDAGNYERILQREYSPEAIRNVAD